jgi:hypothetical protein
MGLGYYMPRYLTLKLIEQTGYAMLCLKMNEDWASTKKDLVQVLLFDKDCNLKEGQDSVQEFVPEDEEQVRKK